MLGDEAASHDAPRRHSRRRVGPLTVGVVAAAVTLWAFLPLPAPAVTDEQRKLDRLRSQIDSARGKICAKKGTERVLTTQIAAYSRRIERLQRRIVSLRERQGVIEADLGASRAELERVRTELRSERARLVRLSARVRETRRMLRIRLVEIYKAEKPDYITVVLNSDGFADLLERGEFIKRISDQDRKVVALVRDAKADATRSERRLDTLERRQQSVTEADQKRRDEVAKIKLNLIDARVGSARTKTGKRAALGSVRGDRRELESELDALVKDSANVQAKLRAAAPGGAPIRAADGGKVVLAGPEGGYGLYTCIQHTATMSTCYAHQSRLGTSAGATVAKGQVMGFVGNTGNSFGNHLHFEVRINGSPVNPIAYL